MLGLRASQGSIDFDSLDAKIDGERQCLVSILRRIADRLDALSPADAIEPLTMLSDQAEAFVRRAERVPFGSPLHRPGWSIERIVPNGTYAEPSSWIKVKHPAYTGAHDRHEFDGLTRAATIAIRVRRRYMRVFATDSKRVAESLACAATLATSISSIGGAPRKWTAAA